MKEGGNQGAGWEGLREGGREGFMQADREGSKGCILLIALQVGCSGDWVRPLEEDKARKEEAAAILMTFPSEF